MTVFLSAYWGIRSSRAVVECEISDVMICFEMFEKVVSTNLPALVNGMKQFAFQP
jgi:hypothetical protein